MVYERKCLLELFGLKFSSNRFSDSVSHSLNLFGSMCVVYVFVGYKLLLRVVYGVNSRGSVLHFCGYKLLLYAVYGVNSFGCVLPFCGFNNVYS